MDTSSELPLRKLQWGFQTGRYGNTRRKKGDMAAKRRASWKEKVNKTERLSCRSPSLSQHSPQPLPSTCLVDPWLSQSLSPDRSGHAGQSQPAGRRNNYLGLGHLGHPVVSFLSAETTPHPSSPLCGGLRLCNPHFCSARLDSARMEGGELCSSLLLRHPSSDTSPGKQEQPSYSGLGTQLQLANTPKASLITLPYLQRSDSQTLRTLQAQRHHPPPHPNWGHAPSSEAGIPALQSLTSELVNFNHSNLIPLFPQPESW